MVTDSSKSSFQVAVMLGKDKIDFWKEDIMLDATYLQSQNQLLKA